MSFIMLLLKITQLVAQLVVSDLTDPNRLINNEMSWKSYERIADKTATHRLNTERVLLFFSESSSNQVQIRQPGFLSSNKPLSRGRSPTCLSYFRR